MDLVTRIREKCTEKGTNIATLEKELNIGNGVIRRWNERNPGAYQVQKIAERLNVSIEYLLTGKETADLSPEEQQLIDYYRITNPTGRAATLATARTNSELMPKEPESSTSKIG